ncbi:MAG: TIGR00730 family Rossman fold protein [archaeon]|nr:TIGR00730 family Rossman fold protein [archaeon]
MGFHKNSEYFSNVEKTVYKAGEEISAGLNLLQKIDKPIVTFFGSHRVASSHPNYVHAKDLAKGLGERGFAIASGGGPGIMHASNSGAMEANAPSLAFKAELLKGEKVTDKIFTDELSFHFLFVRRFIMSIKSSALIFYPGGYGTLNELFEYAVLMQTGIVDTIPLICVNKNYWNGLFNWLKKNPLEKDYFIRGENDLDLLHFIDDKDEIYSLLKK